MKKNVVHVVGTGTIGEPLIGLFCAFRQDLGIDEVTFSKNQALLTDRSKVLSLMRRGAKFCADPEALAQFRAIGVEPSYELEEAMSQASVIVDCTPVGNKNRVQLYEKHLSDTLGFIAQGSEFGFGKPYARGVNDDALLPEKDRFLQIVSCNTHNLSVLVRTIAHDNGLNPEGLKSARFVCVRRANDISQDNSFIPGPSVNRHKEGRFGTHHARDAYELFKTMGLELSLFSSAMKTNTQYMHTIWFHLLLNEKITREEVFRRLRVNDRVALSHKASANQIFSFGRDHGHFGRILNQTVIPQACLEVVNEQEVVGWCFTPQDGNSLLSSVAATEFFLNPENYDNNIQCLKPYFFEEV